MKKMLVAVLAMIATTVHVPAHAQSASALDDLRDMVKAGLFRRNLPACAPDSPPDQACYLPVDFSVTEAEQHLGNQIFAYWMNKQTVRIAARLAPEDNQLCCTFQGPMDYVGVSKTGDIRGVTLRVPHLRESTLVFALSLHPEMKSITWSGENAPVIPKVATLTGRLDTVTIDSPNLGEKRDLSIYTPQAAAPEGGYPVVYMGDGGMVATYAPIVEAMIDRGLIRPVLLVGIMDSHDKRVGEYLSDVAPDLYRRHEAFVFQEVLPKAEGEFHAAHTPGQRLIFGFSNGAAWALGSGLRHADVFENVATNAVAGEEAFDFTKAQHQRFYIGAGTYDSLHDRSKQACDDAKAAGAACAFVESYTGHDPVAAELVLMAALKATFPASH